jgi:antitoxin component YwqK of YwqJK toxin-antitoxin module
MNKLLILLALILNVYSIYSQEKIKNYYTYNNVKFLTSEGQIDEKKKKTGEWIHYYKDFTDTTETEKTQIKSVTNYENGLKNGPYKEFYTSGELMFEGDYENDNKIGVWSFYYENGNAKSILTYNELSFESKKSFDENNKIKEELYYDLKKDETEIKKYNTDGNISSITIKKQDSSYFRKFNNQSELIEEGHRVKNNYDGVRKRYSNGKLIQLNNYKNGKEHGVYKHYQNSGKILVNGSYKENKKHGKWEHYSSKNHLVEVANYNNGILEGIYEKYHYNGKLEQRGNYKDGKKDGEWVKYNSLGDQMSNTIYKEGNVIYGESVITD